MGMKRLLVGLMAISLLSILVVACSQGNTSAVSSSAHVAATSTVSGRQLATVRMDDARFLQSSITIKKGISIMIIDTTATIHVLANGSWLRSGLPRYMVESGAPHVNMQFAGNDSHRIGPFNMAGTFHLYCTVHQGMNLMVLVE